MSKRQKNKIEYRYYDVPANHPALVLYGEKWKQNYGRSIDYLHYHNLFEIGYCHEGNGVLVFQEEEVEYKGEMFTLFPKDYPHTTNSIGTNVCYWEYIFIDVEKIIYDIYKDNLHLMERLLRRINQNAYLIKEQEEPQMASLIKMIIEIARNKKEFYLEEMKSLVIALLLEIARYSKGNDEENKIYKPDMIIMPALTYIRNNYMKQIKIQHLAELCHISETHFRRVFVENIRLTPIEYINFVRINAACDELQRTNDSINAIAMRNGFLSLSTFNRNFQKVMGISPQKWRKNDKHFVRKILNYDVKVEEGW